MIKEKKTIYTLKDIHIKMTIFFELFITTRVTKVQLGLKGL